MEAALRAFGVKVERRIIEAEAQITPATSARDMAPGLPDAIRIKILSACRFHVSGDSDTSVLLYADHEPSWISQCTF